MSRLPTWGRVQANADLTITSFRQATRKNLGKLECTHATMTDNPNDGPAEGIYVRRPGRPFVIDFIPKPIMETTPREPSYLIVGAGCMGASTALHLKQQFPQSNVTLIDRTPFPNPSAAAHDLNKVIRTDYDEIFYMKLALEAMHAWKTDSLLSKHYHETGIVWAGPEKMSDGIIKNYKTLGVNNPAEILEPETARTRWGGILRDTEWTGLKQVLYNPHAGWGDAEQALRDVIQKAVDLGVKYVAEGALKVLLHSDGTCVGVQTQTGNIIKADRTILCTGANTAQLLADSAPEKPELQVDRRLVAAAAIMCLYKVPESEVPKYESAPIIINVLDHTQGKITRIPGIRPY